MTGYRYARVASLAIAITAVLGAGASAHPTGGESDPGFGTGTPSASRQTCGAGGPGVFDAAVQADGESVLVGESTSPTGNNFCIVRIEEDGGRDPAFGDGDPDTAWSGDGETEIGFGAGAGARAVAIQPDGRAVVAGYVRGADGSTPLAVTRLDTDGTLDTTFGDGGRRIVDTLDPAEDVLVQPDGRIVLVTTASANPVADAVTLLRLTTDGAPDPSFGGGDGIASAPPLGRTDEAVAGALQADGRILVTGRAVSIGSEGILVARFNSDGSLDASFAGDGATAAYPRTDNRATAVFPGPGGSVTVVGQGFNRVASTRADILIARFTAAGRLDRGFAPGGVRAHFLGGSVVASDAVPAEDGGLTVVGGFDSSSARLRSSYFVAKTLPNGMIDRNFARHTVTFGAPVEATAMTVVPVGGGSVMLAGPASTPFTAVQLLGPRVRTLNCRGELSGSAAPDRLRGTSSADAIFGKGSADRLAGLGGGDCLRGGAGDDVLSGGAGDDRLGGDSGADTIRTGGGRNVVRGGAGSDRVNSRNGRRDVVNCGTGRDRATVDRADRVAGCEAVSRG